MSQRSTFTARLRQSVPLSDATRHLQFEVEDLPSFDFEPGQFISMQAEHDGREITRAYSIASSPKHESVFDVCLNRVREGFFSNLLCDLPEGSRVKFHGPHGYFILKNPVRDSIFIGTGTGIAPLRGMLHWLYEEPGRNQGREFWLVFGVRSSEDLYYHDEFKQMEAQHSNFHYVPTLSRPDENWTGARGYVQEHVREIVGDRKDMDAYICGLKDMVKANRDLLVKDLGWDRKSVLYERFD
ncbi:MAG TPA: FAD-dependent oxidoreductase [Terriglobales bacterium]|nr:FAD-dependent oxidoreductase [Terriglobales bacterium]